MSVPTPARIGMPLEDVETPALLVDLDALERNLKRMQELVADTSVRLRPHAKTHKCPNIALRQLELGAVGVCCQKVGEAEAMVNGGVMDVFVSNEIAGRSKVARLAALARQAHVGVAVDDAVQVNALAEAAQAYHAQLDVYVEVDVGGNRCGVGPGEPVLQLAQAIDKARGLHFKGFQAYHGRAQHLRTPEERREAIYSAVNKVEESRALLEKHGLATEIISGAGTGTFRLEMGSGVYNELQAGSYVFMDADYARNLDEEGKHVREFEHSLFVLATVMSRPTRERAVLDAGLKAYSVDSGMPTVPDMPQVELTRASDEHGTLHLHDPETPLGVGDQVTLVPGHCDPTVNLYDWLVGYRGDRVEALWPVAARGAGH